MFGKHPQRGFFVIFRDSVENPHLYQQGKADGGHEKFCKYFRNPITTPPPNQKNPQFSGFVALQ